MKGILAIFLSVFRIVVIPVQFQDRELTYGQEDFRKLTDNASLYLDAQFRGTRTFEFTIASPVTLKHPMPWYGTNGTGTHDLRINEAVGEACRASDEEIDFSGFDNDGDGNIDCIALLTAGLSESDGAGEDMIWPQQGRLSDTQSTFQIDGKTADSFVAITELKSDYGLNPRLGGIGDLCHELLHIMGLPDFYDTDGEVDGLGKGLWKTTALMDSGNRNEDGMAPPNLNAIEMEMLKLGTCDTLGCGSYRLTPINRDGRYLKLLTPVEGEYFLIECREAKGWDRSIGGEGLLVYHIDRSEPDYSSFWETNRINAVASRQGACLLAADPQTDEVSKVFFPRPGKTAITSDTDPSLHFNGGGSSPMAITGIRMADGGAVEFNVSEPIIIRDVCTFQDAAIVSWTCGPDAAPGPVTVRWYLDGVEAGCADASGAEVFTIEHLRPHTAYEVRVTVMTKGGDSCSFSSGFMTKTYREDLKPYIYLNSADRNPDGSFIRGSRIPLRVSNVIDAEKTEWTFNSHPAAAGPDGFFTIQSDGRLKAKVYHADGTTDILVKDITVR